MQPLLNELALMFDLDHEIRGVRLGELVEKAFARVDEDTLEDWGTPGSSREFKVTRQGNLDFYYAPHLFPDMDAVLKLGHKLQFHLLPREIPAEAPLSVSAVLESYCHLSGDLFGWQVLADGRLLVWIVDISGHGVRAGLASAVLRVLVDNLRQRGKVASLTRELNETFNGCLREDRNNMYATGFFMAVEQDGTAAYTLAGHPPVLLRRADGTVDELSGGGLPIGMFPDSEYDVRKLQLAPGDTLLLYTDGVLESTNKEGRAFGLERLRDVLASSGATPADVSGSLFREISRHQNMDELEDDLTFVCLRMEPQRT
ncbi:hypothetical protein ABI59_10075 [Acidobacteria bacterium Mor1]|nr:hypothetical protein ABI59_10075 [Acidobacteria bacterium Mor1]